ncbi:glyoxylase-like metal-dependent hydrolase (beta-lactamase superfamily II) [Alkalibacillus filiformis]|uniref:Glyoxylase-like metal-dependent hydrolase (Beta-lactamase superfamily II) n=1 Tax=Alkalibacillus filiformis TaxID=200990 RepID=A0ABU0DR19_9BACI|nr:MBL fold metallo-hydrolase [Alkalibacillus filiformis]MDQ0350758.1 glyoxylase-like metal-dependent hydrolase (beta-lactamase superfamily II) [Alkalibacillus filiformis]
MSKEMNYGDDYKFIPATSIGSGVGKELLTDLYQHTIQVVNLFFYGDSDSNEFVLIDAGMPRSFDDIKAVAAERFGEDTRPKAVILTHGHFDHVGAIIELIEHWDVPVYAHELEKPYLTGEKDYPEPDSSVEGGLVAKMSPIFPNEAIDIRNHLEPLHSDGSVPHMPGFRWVHTPGHTPGHVSLFRDEDGTLIVGDAFVTVRQDSLYKVFTQEKEISGPPRYLTTDWQQAWDSVKKLAELKPTLAATGHGVPLYGDALNEDLSDLVQNFEEIAIPDHGKYI